MTHSFTDYLKWLRNHSIRNQSIFFFTIIVGVVCAFIYIYFPSRLENQAIESTEDKARSIARMIAYDVSATLIFHDTVDMDKILVNAKQNKDLAYLVIMDENNFIFSQLNFMTAINAKYIDVPQYSPITADKSIYRAACGIYHNDKEIGHLYLGLSLDDLHARVNKSRRDIAILSTLLFICGVAAVFFTSTIITNPLKKMIETIEKISHGDLSQRIAISSNDELGNLGASFNLMIQNLEAYSGELKRLNNNLENEVAERTKKLQVEVNERRLAQEALVKSEEKYRLLVDNSLVGIYIAHDHTITFCNQRFANAFGYQNPVEIIDKHLSELVTQESWERVNADPIPKPGAPSANNARRYELKGVKKDGSIFDIETLHHLLLDPGQSAFEGILIDITERKQAEAEKEKLESQLRQSQKMESIGTLAGGIAHDFNNILGAVIGYTELALERVPNDPQATSYLERVIGASIRAKDMIRQILTFSRKSEKERTLIHLNEIVEEALNLMRSTLPTTIEIRKNLPHMKNPVRANTSEIHQIMMNLCANAAHAMKNTGGILSVELKEITLSEGPMTQKGLTPGVYQHLIVTDTGCGMPPQVMNRIFEPYFTTKKDGEGTGMGLSVVHGIIKSYGGEISVYSEPGKGTTFHVFLPVVETDSNPKQAKPEELYGQSSPTAPHANARILFIDDDPLLVDLGKDILERWGYRITPFTSSVEALNTFRSEYPTIDLVISDQTMPQMTGIQLIQQMREIKPEIPFILCSGFSESVSEDTYKSLGINAYLMKPIIRDELLRTVREILDGITS
ncbi:MAG: ATP-binding protein [Candidatus Omnitrophota bacterium]